MRINYEDVLKRHRAFSSDEVESGLLLSIYSIDELMSKTKPIEEWDLPKEHIQYTDSRIDALLDYVMKRQSVKDDFLPSIAPWFGIAEHSAFVGGKVTYGGDTSYHHHPLTDWSLMDDLTYDEDNENFAMLMSSLRHVKKRSETEGFIPRLRGVMAPMDMANAIRGNDLFMDLYDNAANVKKLCEFCLEAGKWTMKHQKEIVGQINGGTMTGFGIWVPGDSVGQVSEDASSLCSVDSYREFGRPYTERLLENYDGALVHIHTIGRHVLPEVAAMDKVKYIELSYDPAQPKPIDVYKEYGDVLKDQIVVLNATPEDIRDNCEFLQNRKTVVMMTCGTLAEAESIADFVKSELPL